MKRILVILLAVLPMMVAGQMVQPVTWTGEDRGRGMAYEHSRNGRVHVYTGIQGFLCDDCR